MLSRDPIVQKLSRRLVAERGVPATPIVKDFDIRKELGDRFVPCRVARAMHTFVLQTVEEALARGVDAPMSRVCRRGSYVKSLSPRL